jgi:hypothetical protein
VSVLTTALESVTLVIEGTWYSQVFFNDKSTSHLLLANYSIVVCSRLDFQDLTGRMSSHSINALPSYLKNKWTLLSYVARYMDENLIEGGDSQSVSPRCRASFIHMKRWVRTPKTIIMQLDNKTFQVITKSTFYLLL